MSAWPSPASIEVKSVTSNGDVLVGLRGGLKIGFGLREEAGKIEGLIINAARICGGGKAASEGAATGADQIDDITPEHAVAFQLRLAKPLVRGRLVRKGRVCGGIGANISRLGAVVTRLDVDQQPRFSRGFRIANIGDRAVDSGDRLLLACH